MNVTNTHVAGVTFEERKIDLPIGLDLILLVLAYAFLVGAIAILLLKIV
jgi:hypothetical protein